jgi:hypothetical protein
MHCAIVPCIHEMVRVHIYILYDIFIRVSKNEGHRLGWMKSWNWNLVATSIIRKIHQGLGRILWYASMLINENTRSSKIEDELSARGGVQLVNTSVLSILFNLDQDVTCHLSYPYFLDR